MAEEREPKGGGKAGQGRKRVEPAPTSPDPIEIAMEAEASGEAPTGFAHEVLRRQSALIGWQIANERMGFVLRVMTWLAGLTVAAVAGFLVWQASRADGLVVEPFSTPPELAARGLTGPVVAGEVLDQLMRLRIESRDPTGLRISDAWSADIRVEIPQTGISLDDLNRLLRRWFGHQTLVSGAVVTTSTGIALSAQGAGGRIVRAGGSPGDLPALSGQLAEQLLAQTSPLSYGSLMMNRQRPDDAIRIYTVVINTADSDRERGQAHQQLGLVYQMQQQTRDAATQYRQAVDLGNPGAATYLGFMERALGHDNAAARWMRVGEADARRGTGAFESMDVEDRIVFARGAYGLLTGNFGSALRDFNSYRGRSRSGASANGIENIIRALIPLHETTAARNRLPAMMAVSTNISQRLQQFNTALMAQIAAEEGNWPLLLETLDTSPASPNPGMLGSPTPDAWRARALAHLGRLAEAQAMAASLPGDCYRCLRTGAEVAELAGDRAGADRWYAEAVRQNPDLPFADTDWASTLLARGQPALAIQHAKAAHKASPNFADPLELWGEALLAQGDAKGAAAKFEAAAKLAPLWGRLHLRWGEALAKLGKAADARAKWRAASGMDLSPSDRAALKGHQV